MAVYERDPLSELFDAGARQLLDRAYAARGQWVRTRVADPGPRQLVACAELGIDPFGPDDSSAKGGRGLDAKTRWCRAFVRAVYYQHRWYSGTKAGAWRRDKRMEPRHSGAIEIEIGRRVPVLGVIPAGRAVRIRIRPGGETAKRAAKRMAAADRIYTDRGRPGERHSDPAKRDWQPA